MLRTKTGPNRLRNVLPFPQQRLFLSLLTGGGLLVALLLSAFALPKTFPISTSVPKTDSKGLYHLTNIWTVHLKFTPEQWEELNYNDMTFNAEDSVRIGFAEEIGEFTPPPGANIFTV